MSEVLTSRVSFNEQMTDDGLFQVAWSGFTKGVHHKAEDDPQINQHQDKVGKLFYQLFIDPNRMCGVQLLK